MKNFCILSSQFQALLKKNLLLSQQVMAYVGKTESEMEIAVFREHTKQKNMLMFTETARHSIPEKKIYVTQVTLS
jgi:hypothetical protein